jgi:hypothetical protein
MLLKPLQHQSKVLQVLLWRSAGNQQVINVSKGKRENLIDEALEHLGSISDQLASGEIHISQMV